VADNELDGNQSRQSPLNPAIEAEIMSEQEWFGLHDITRRGTTNTAGSVEYKLESTRHKSRQMKEIWDKSVSKVKTPK